MSHNRIKIKLILQGRTMAQTNRTRDLGSLNPVDARNRGRLAKLRILNPKRVQAASRWFRNRSNEDSITATNKAALLTQMIEIIVIQIRLIKILATKQ